MEKSSGSIYDPASGSHQLPVTHTEPRPRFGLASALVRIAVALAILGFAIFQVISWVSERPEPPQRVARERTFTVQAIEPVYATQSAPISAFGQVAAARSIDIRAQVQGRVLEVSPNLALGGQVEEGEMLVRIDPFSYDGAVVGTRAQIADAELALAEAREAYTLEERNIAAAQNALAAAATDLDRARSLLASGAATQQTVEARELTVSEREQALIARQSNLLTLDAQIQRQQGAIAQAQYSLQSAERDRANTEILAPFTGIVTARNLTAGGYVNANEAVASLYESAALEVSFMISDAAYTVLQGDGLIGRSISVRPATGSGTAVEGEILRVAPQIETGSGGVVLYGAIGEDGALRFRPGAFVSIAVEGVAHENALRVPETAIYDDSYLYVIREGRMAAVPLTILDRDGAQIIVSADIPEGERIINNRLSQAGDGVAVIVEGEEPVAPDAPRAPQAPGAPAAPGDGARPPEGAGERAPANGGAARTGG